MGVSHKTIKNEFPSMKKNMELLDGKGVEVGVLKGEHAWLASIHEYGCDINVTKKMRRFLASQGLYLSKNTTHIHIPERSFLRTGFDENVKDVKKKAAILMAKVLDGDMSAAGCFTAVGLDLSSKIKDHARDLSSPANHPFTIDRKGSSNPLVKTGDMIGGITWRKSK